MTKKKDVKKNKAVALSYKESYNAPKVIAKGRGEIADKIVNVGKKEKIEIYKDEDLIEKLIRLDLCEEIPPELYEAVSKIILFVYYLDKEKGESYE
ncbi:EscU/YscU/HrcU family type III secretion system export apparatus switch protein [Schnuerera sp. xch1]|uniref:EscU/YscU/HrcU family type III secretion system export apparatus switch protein n=1 Tax=Schnuerera sp. xch1 TaxID=2874283 RepID=UPI001CC014AC|nr:EscU/YscU/HrcU family type III secretion system export apparatus switch protein [Schnuerera sp. xch1]MBZ2173890.1 EscU/YscU/HrcU family type III secretion system export apparatus switch protein [Schnuerera sp. xch1]